MPTIFGAPQELLGAVGRKLGPSEWLVVDQPRIDQFAAATGDHQWIHVDPERAKSGPFGATIAHGYLTLSLVNALLPQLLEVREVAMGVNYGCDRVRFPAPVRVGARVRALGEVIGAEEVKGGAVQVTVRVSVEIEHGDRPACVVDTISRFVPVSSGGAR